MRRMRDPGYVGDEMPALHRLQRQDLLDALIAAALATLAVATIFSDPLEHPRAALVPIALAMTVPLAWRRRRPLAVLVIVLAAVAALALVSPQAGGDLSVILVTLVVTYSVGANAERRTGLIGLAIAIAATALGLATAPDPHGAGDYLFVAVLFGGAWGLGAALRDRVVRTARLEERATALERDRDEHTRRAIEAERSRIARELHDVIGHSISVMGVQAGAVRSVLPSRAPARARGAAGGRADGREAIGEMRRLIGLLRIESGVSDGPQPSLLYIESLADEMRATGRS